MNRFFALLVVIPVLSGCGGSQPPVEPAPVAPAEPAAEAPAPAPAPTAAEAPAPAEPAKLAWKDMNRDQRIEHMKNVVTPKMKEAFVAFDEKKYANMDCSTCHGPGAKDGTFKMPNAALPKLPKPDGFAKLKEKHPKGMDFMMTKVVPEMAALLDTQPYDPQTHQGLGCAACHVMEM